MDGRRARLEYSRMPGVVHPSFRDRGARSPSPPKPGEVTVAHRPILRRIWQADMTSLEGGIGAAILVVNLGILAPGDIMHPVRYALYLGGAPEWLWGALGVGLGSTIMLGLYLIQSRPRASTVLRIFGMVFACGVMTALAANRLILPGTDDVVWMFYAVLGAQSFFCLLHLSAHVECGAKDRVG